LRVLKPSQRWLRIGAVLCGISALSLAPTRGIAQGALSFDRRGCADPWADGIERFVAIELGAAPEDRPDGELDISVRCQGEEVEIEASERGAASTRRRMDLSGTADSVRSRVVALAIAGLTRELGVIARSTAHAAAERAAAPIAPSRPPTAGTPEPEPDREPSALPSVQLDLLVTASTFTASPGLLWGGGVRARASWLAPLYLALDAQIGTYGRESELGSARLVAGSAGARIGWTYSWISSAFGAGVGQRFGFARASASADATGATGSSLVGPWAAPFAFVAADTALSRQLRLGVDAELGTVLLPVRGRIEEGVDIAAAGAFIALCATLGLQL
jgi:hypothetical protein